ncbi:hypothetical protein RFI_03269 [Reticulomyxa filosa]|uniref:Serine aminopeptidase S33 domain-containing protein n=1 Tax=Reticulomyxa filosa TaxID=46433 RepID=X6P6M7_RETFI|nr:hypothetical protein RFI_03269 [Reticulomyxa filosa]|eukprot:ETO33831.1 hypothetical protein RFI_03269 [Reticulomyxa filosa]
MPWFEGGLSNVFSWFSSVFQTVFPQRGDVYSRASRTVHLSLFVGGAAMLIISRSRKNHLQIFGTPTKDPTNFDYSINRRKALQALPLPKLVDKEKLKNIKIVEGYNPNARGELLFYRCFLPQHKKAQGLLFFVSGYNADSDHLYYVMGVELANLGYIMFTFDHYGHGRSDGLWTYIHTFDYLVDDACLMSEFAKQQFGHSKMDYFLYGSSMGGCYFIHVYIHMNEYTNKLYTYICIYIHYNIYIYVYVYVIVMLFDFAHMCKNIHLINEKDNNDKASLQRWNGCVLLAPMIAIDPSLYPPRVVVWLLRYVVKHLVPTFQLPGIGNDLLSVSSRDTEMIKWLRDNPVIYSYGTRVQTAESLLNACDLISNNLDRVSIPILILHGEADKVTSYHMSERLYKEATSKDKVLKLFKDAYHLLFGDICKDEVYQVCLEWMKERSGHEVFQSESYYSLTFKEKVQLSKTSQT